MVTRPSAVLEIQIAVQAALTSDTALMALVTGVFGEAPEGQSAPYITYGQHVDGPYEMFGSVNSEALILFDIWSNQRNDDECYAILAETRRIIETRPDNPPLALPSYDLAEIRYEWSTIIQEQESSFRHMPVRFHTIAIEKP
jgi:hypothetical protein